MNLILLTAASAAQVVIQFLIQVVIAYQFGARADADALAAALAVPTLLAAVISGSLSYVLVPELVACFSQTERELVGWRQAGMTGLITTAIALLASVAVVGSAGTIVEGLYGELPSAMQQETARLLGILAWQIVMSTLISWSLAVHHSRHSFIIPALGGVIGTLATLALAVAKGRSGIEWIAIAINVGAAVSVAIHVAPLAARLRIGNIPRSQLVRLLWTLMPLILGSIYLRIDPVVDRSLASRLSEGSVAHLHYAQRIIVALLTISTSGLSVVAFPQLAGRLATEGSAGFVTHFAIATRRLVLITVPIAIGFSFFAVPVIGDLLKRGRFTVEDSQVVGWLIVCFMGMFVGASWGELLSRGFYTFGDTRTPVVVGAITLTIGLACKFLSLSVLGVWGIAGSTSLSFMLSAVTMAVLLRIKTQGPIFSGCLIALGQAALASLAACGMCLIPYTFQLGRTWTAAPLGAVTYAAVLWLLGSRDARAMTEWLLRPSPPSPLSPKRGEGEPR
ncbi:MAG: murein biosynthesis integral membrane protein MurJ [Aureliella sp.]